jgi:hypothetical protein
VTDLLIGCQIFLFLSVLGLPALAVLVVATHLEGYVRIPWMRVAQACCGVALCGVIYAQGSMWAQQQAEELRSIGRDVGRLQTEMRLATRDIGSIQGALEEKTKEIKEDIADHETRLREVESSVNRAYAIFAVLAFLAPAIFQGGMWVIQSFKRNGRNGHQGESK